MRFRDLTKLILAGALGLMLTTDAWSQVGAGFPVAPQGGGGSSSLANGSTPGIATGDGSTIVCTSGVCVASTGGSAGISQLTGDVTAGPGSGSQAATLAATAVTAGSYGSSTSIPSLTVDAKGRLTAAAGNAVVAPAGTLSGTTLNATVVTSSLTSTGTLVGGASGAGFTLNLGTSTVSGNLPNANLTGAYTNVTNFTDSGTTTFGGITGSTQCLHVNTSGVLSGTGSDCGSGGGGGLTVGSTGITSGTSGRLLYDNAGVLGESVLTAGTPNLVVTTPTTLATTTPINAQVGTTYTVLTGDNTKLVTLSNASPVAVTLPQAGSAGFASGWSACFANVNTGLVTITTTTSTINGSGSTSILPQGASGCLASDGTNWQGTIASIKIPGTSGGIPYYAATNELLSSAALAANAIVVGGGAGAAPATDANATLSAGALSLGASGTAGSVAMGNATSGTITLQPVTGALGSVTASLPANTGTVGELNLAQTWSAVQTFNANDFKLGGVTGSTQCLHADTTGVVTGTGSDCGAGGSGIGTKIATCATASTTCNFNALGSHAYYTLKCSGLTVGTASSDMELQVNSDSTSGHYAWGLHYTSFAGTPTDGSSGSASDTRMLLANSLATTISADFEARMGNIASTALMKNMEYHLSYADATNKYSFVGGGTFAVTGTAVTSIQVLTSAGTFGAGSGSCTLYAYDS